MRTEEHRRRISEGQMGHTVSLETKQKIGKGNKGKYYTEETKRKMSESHKGNAGYWEGKKHTEEQNRKNSESNRGRIPWNKGLTKETDKRIRIQGKHNSEAQRGKFGEKAHNWKGGITPIEREIRASTIYSLWRKAIFLRDKFQCQECGQISGKLNVHHKKAFAKILQYYEITTWEEVLKCEELWDIDNGITLCEKCHKEKHIANRLVKVVISSE